MPDEGKYLYCIIQESSHHTFGPIGISGRGDEVHTICYRDIACVISSSPMTQYVISRENLLAHEKVIEEVMQEYTVLPVRFCTIATSVDEIRSLLMRRYQEFKILLRSMDNKVELGLKAFWLDMDEIFREIGASDRTLKLFKEELQKRKDPSLHEKITLGKKAKNALERKKEIEREEIIQALRPICVDVRLNKTFGDNTVLNCAFLVDRTQEREFDDLVERLNERCKERLKFVYVGPAPPFNFVDLQIKWGSEE